MGKRSPCRIPGRYFMARQNRRPRPGATHSFSYAGFLAAVVTGCRKELLLLPKLPGRRWKVYVISAAGGRPEQVTHGEDDEGDVSWSSATTLVFGAMGVGLQSPSS